MENTQKNIFSEIPSSLSEELFSDILSRPSFRLERIVSDGQATPLDEWLQQDSHEWVIVLSGRAALLFSGEPEPRLLARGDYVFIPAKTKHRVEWTDNKEKTVWLALHYL